MIRYAGLLLAATLFGGCVNNAEAEGRAKGYEILNSRFATAGSSRLVADVRINGQKIVGVAYDRSSVNADGGDEFRLWGEGGEIIRIAGNEKKGAVWFINYYDPLGTFARTEEKGECPWKQTVGHGKDVSCARAVELGREAERIYEGLAPLLAAEFEKRGAQKAVARRHDSVLENL